MKVFSRRDEIIKYEFVSVYEPEFKEFYDNYFSTFNINDEGLIVINQRIPLYYSTLIYWILTTSHVNGFILDNISCEIKDTTIILTLDTKETIKELDINNNYTIKEQIEKIGTFSSTNPYILSIYRIIDIEIMNKVKKCIGEFYPNKKDVDLGYGYRYEKIGEIIQKSEMRIKNLICKGPTYDEFINKYRSLMEQELHKVLINHNFVTIITLVKNGEYNIDELSVIVDTEFEVIIYPINHWYNIIGQQWDILQSYYFGTGKYMQGFNEWAWNNFKIKSDTNEELYNKIKKYLI